MGKEKKKGKSAILSAPQGNESGRSDFLRPSVTVDIVVFTLIDADLKLLLIRRNEPPFKGFLALPGGFVRVGPTPLEQGEDLDEAAARELTEETGLPASSMYLEQLHTFGRAGRDPRTRVISVAYFALIRPDLAPFVHAGGDAADAGWHSLTALSSITLAFDHREILDRAIVHIRATLEHSNIAFELVPATFTIPELRSVHEIIMGVTYDPGNFRRRFQRMVDDGIIEVAPGKRITVSKPAVVYRFKGRNHVER